MRTLEDIALKKSYTGFINRGCPQASSSVLMVSSWEIHVRFSVLKDQKCQAPKMNKNNVHTTLKTFVYFWLEAFKGSFCPYLSLACLDALKAQGKGSKRTRRLLEAHGACPKESKEDPI